MTPFKDTSIMQGVLEFVTDTGEEVRAMDRTIHWDILIKEGDAYIYCGSAIKVDDDTPEIIWDRYVGVFDSGAYDVGN
jgi:hypothetical protein